MLERDPNIIPFSECKTGYLYRISARNSRLGIFVKETGGFVILREKFSHEYLFVELHWDVDSRFGTVTPIKELEHFGDIPEWFRTWYDSDEENIQEKNDYNSKMFSFLKEKLKEHPFQARIES